MTRTTSLLILLTALAACDTSALLGGNQEPAEEVITLEPDPSAEIICPEGVDLPDCPA